jgi:hypothetical protein
MQNITAPGRQLISSDELNQLRIDLLKDFFYFTRVFFEIKTGRPFYVSQPDGNVSHFLEVAKELTDVFLVKTKRLIINLPPGWGKSQLCKSFVAWCMAHYPDSKFMYISHSFELATMHTADIKQIMSLPFYKYVFNIEIRRDSSAKDFFQTTAGGAVAAFGSAGGITGHDAGLPGLDRFSGCLIVDDIHKPDEVHSDTIRERIKRNYFETIERRLRSPNVPVLFIGQRLHEDDLPAHLLSGADGQEWRKVIIKALDDAGNSRYPEVNPKKQLLIMKEKQPYVFSSQYQQDPMPAGGALFKEDSFLLLEKMPKIIATFITADTAETDKEWNDATAFSFWGIYQVEYDGVKIDDLYALHWLDCAELRIEPKDLKNEFLDFWVNCMRFSVKPKFAAIEKKSTGTTLISVLSDIQGLQILNIDRSGVAKSKTNRFLEIQPYINNRQVTLPSDGKHIKMCIDHMKKITANNVHRFDDICDTVADAVKIALIDDVLLTRVSTKTNYDEIGKTIFGFSNRVNQLKSTAYR